MKYTYYPGCSLKGTGRNYGESLTAVYRALDHDLEPLADFNCCGFIAYMSIDQAQALALAARNLSLAEQGGVKDLLTPCTACQVVLNRVDDFRVRYPKLMDQVLGTMREWGLEYRGTVKIKHPLEVLYDDVGIEAIKARGQGKLSGFRVACYYGCLYNRPHGITEERFFPTRMEEMFSALGIEPVDYHLKTKCCGGSLSNTVEAVGLHSIFLLLQGAKRLNVDAIATTCPLCQFNLEAYQDRVSSMFGEDVRVPVMYFSQVLGMEFGLSGEQLGLQRLFVPAKVATA
ncbi:MAG: CoB--CoM heterodisulfide reductase iron-sulfur subunit B family protein [Dehalococcoidia bacterium]|nr:CoB--CoM heterodisulfide reductase iron-sulfur subunit B family protein [Dehalococcoidia bacterium]